MNNSDRSHWCIANRVRMLWMQHGEWIKMAFVAIIFNNPDEERVLQRLLRNPADFARFFDCFFGREFSFSFKRLLTEHLELAAALVRALMANDTQRADKINTKLYKNADDLAAALTSANPYWRYEEWRTMLCRHLDLAKKIASEMINDDYKESIATYDYFEAEIMLMADQMIKGLLKYCVIC